MTTSANISSSSSSSSTNSITCTGKHKSRLLIGEGNFSFALALINKHDQKAQHSAEHSLGHSIIATELISKIHCKDCDIAESFETLKITDKEEVESKEEVFCEKCTVINERISTLRQKGVQVILGVDGTKMHEREEFQGKTFFRIHWNCPHDGSDFTAQTLPKIISDFFMSCASMQKRSDRVHITLAQPPLSDKKYFYQGYVYDIASAASLAGYKIVKKRQFDNSRYPGYEHMKTNKNEPAPVIEQGMKEFVFQRVKAYTLKKSKEVANTASKGFSITDLTTELTKYSKKDCVINTRIYYGHHRAVYNCCADDDSSDYESS